MTRPCFQNSSHTSRASLRSSPRWHLHPHQRGGAGGNFRLFLFFSKDISATTVQLCHVVLFSPQLRCYCLRTVLMTLLSIRQASEQKSSVFYCCALSVGESPIVPLNNWDQRICLLYFFFSPWSATKLLVLSPRSIASVTRPERKRRRGATERGRERKGKTGRESEICAHNGDCRYAKYLWFLIRELPLALPLGHRVTW